MKLRLLCVGDLNADITVVGESDIVTGSDTPGLVALAAGGSAANVAAGAVASGGRARFAGVVGDDPLGAMLTDELARNGVDVRAIVRWGATSRAVAAIIDTTGDRSMVSDLSSDATLRIDDVDTGWFEGVDWLHLTAYTWFAEGGAEVFARLVDLASRQGIPWSIDPSSAQMLRSSGSVPAASAAFGGAAVMFPNHDEAAVLAGVDDPRESSTRLLDIAETVVVTCGADGVVVARRNRSTFSAPAHPVTVVNTLGAGDAFAAGFIAARLSGRDDEASAQAGLAAAAQAVGRSTAR